MNTERLTKFEKVISRASRRLRLQKCADAFMLGIAAGSVPLAILLFVWRIIETSFIPWAIALCAAPLLILLVFHIFKPIDKLFVAQKIDIANDFQERLSSAYSFAKKGESGVWIDAQLEDTLKRLPDVNPDLAFPNRAPKYWKPAIGGILLVLIAAFVPIPRSSVDVPELPVVVEAPPEAPVYRSNIEAGLAQMREDQLEELVKMAEEAGDQKQAELARELLQLIKDDQDGKLSPEEFNQKRDEIEEKLNELPEIPEQVQDKVDNTVQNAIQSTPEMKNDPATQKLSEALEKNDYEQAADILKDLLEQAEKGNLSEQQLEKLAKTFEKFADKLNLMDPELQKALKENKDLIDKLEKKLDKNKKLTNKEQKSLDDAKQKEQELQNARKEGENTPEGKELKKLENAFKKASEKLRKAAQPKSDSQPPSANPSQQPNKEGQQAAQQNMPQNGEQPNKGQQNANDGSQNADGSEPNPTDGDTDRQRQDENGENADGSNENAENGENKDGQAGDREPSDALKDQANQKKSREGKEQLKKAADKIKKDAQRSEGSNNQEQQSEREKNVQDFLKKAKGQKDGQTQDSQQGEQQDAQQGQQGAAGEQQDGGEQGEQGQGQSMEKIQQMGLGAQQEAGKGHTTAELDSPSQIDAAHTDSTVQSRLGKGASTSEIIREVGQEGFASEAYREVYQNYEKAAEEALEQEDIPQGYKHYIERYFDYIRPQN